MTAPATTEPFPIFALTQKYLIYDADTVAYVRRTHNICGVFIGGLPQAPQQNVFLGLPLEVMPEEARLLVDKGVAYIVDDVRSHKRGFLGVGLSIEERREYQAALRRQGVSAAREAVRRTGEKKKTALVRKIGEKNWNDIPQDMLKPGKVRQREAAELVSDTQAQEDNEATLFSLPPPSQEIRSRTSSSMSTLDPEPYGITPTTSYPPLSTSQQESAAVPPTPPSYPLFSHLNSQGYFLAPGLRFGCQYMAYPGDPLRFHSHFLCNGMEWDQEFDLLDLVGGGRLGTGVKKGFVIGGAQIDESVDKDNREDDGVRTFCIEWAGM